VLLWGKLRRESKLTGLRTTWKKGAMLVGGGGGQLGTMRAI